MQSFMSVAGGGILLRAHPAAKLDIFFNKRTSCDAQNLSGFFW